LARDRADGGVRPAPGDEIDLAIVDLPGAPDPGVFEFLAALVRELAPLGRPAPAVLSGNLA
jgi:hypothetical protein